MMKKFLFGHLYLCISAIIVAIYLCISFLTSASAISNLSVTSTNTSATITYTTPSLSLDWVRYGADKSLKSEFKGKSYGTRHTVTLTKLIPNTTYYFHIRTLDLNQNASAFDASQYSSFYTSDSESVKGLQERLTALQNQAKELSRPPTPSPVIASTRSNPGTLSFSRNLQVGNTGADVKALQVFLKITPQTGYFGPLTKTAVVKFQKQYTISPQSGLVGILTRTKLNALLAENSKSPVTSGQVATSQPVIQTPAYSGSGGGGGGGSSPAPSSATSYSPPATPATTPTPTTVPTPTPAPASAPAPVIPPYIPPTLTPANTECSDGIDNNGDGKVDMADPNCFLVNGQETNTNYGYTLFTPSADTRIIYVSNSEGSDTNNGLSVTKPVKTLAYARTLMRNTYPDWMLLKRGDTWDTEELRFGTFSGRSAAAPALIASYGTSTVRPRLINSDVYLKYQEPVSNLSFIGLEFERTMESPNISTAAMNIVSYGDNILLEDLYIHGYGVNINAQGLGGPLNNFKVRRSVIADAYSSVGAHSQGLFLLYANNAVIEDSIFDHDGWSETVPGAKATVFNHNMYLKESPNLIVRNVISARASATGLQQRTGGLNEDNLFLQNPIGLAFGHWQEIAPSAGIIRRNVTIDGRDIGNGPRGFGLWLEHVNGVDVYDNIIAHQQNGTQAVGITTDDIANVSLHDNIVYDWNHPANPGFALNIGKTAAGVNPISNNIFEQTHSRIIGHDAAINPALFPYSGNRYYSADGQNIWFDIARVALTPSAWLTQTGETGATFGTTTFTDPARTMATYNASLGGTASLEAFLGETRKQSKFNWRPQYTAFAANAYIRAGFTQTGFTPVNISGGSSGSSGGSPPPSSPPSSNPTSPPPSGPSDITTGLVSKYAFDYNANDSLGGNNGTLSGSPSFVTGKLGQALSFDGVDDYVTIPHNSSFDFGTGDFSIAAWIKTSGYVDRGSGINVIIARGNAPDYMGLSLNSGSYIRADINGVFMSGTTSVGDGQWKHVVITRVGSAASIYINGVLDARGSVGAGSINSNDDLIIGNDTNANMRAFTGSIDDVRIYNRALSVADVSALYNNGAGVASNQNAPYLANTLEQMVGVLQKLLNYR